MIIYNSWIIKNLFVRGTIAATIGFIILVRDGSISFRTRRHEEIHVRQWIELSILGAIIISALSFILNYSILYSVLSIFLFYIWYIVEYILRWIYLGFNQHKAYRSISFEQEAYTDEQFFGDRIRPIGSFKFIKYLTKWNI